MTNCNHVDMRSSCSSETALFCPQRSVLECAGTDLFRGKISKKDWSVKTPLHWLIMGVAGS